MALVNAENPAVSVDALDAFVGVLAQAEGGVRRDAFYGRLCEVICRLGAMDRAVLFRYDPGVRRVRAAGAHGLDVATFADANVTVESAPIARESLLADRVLDASVAQVQVPDAYRPLLRHHGNLFCIPLTAAGRWIGVVLCDREEARGLTDAERDVLWGLGKTAALAASARIATYDSERARELRQRIDLARDVHDGVVQRLFGLSLALDGSGPLAERDRVRAAGEIQSAMGELRSLLERPLARDPRRAASTLAEELARLADSEPDVPVVADGEIAVPEHLEALAQSVLAEALRNAHKHARPSRVTVSTRTGATTFVLEIVNDGLGTAAKGTTGAGLRLAAFDAVQAGGVLDFGDRRPGVWTVRLVVPVGDAR